jgi:hypothetical protein
LYFNPFFDYERLAVAEGRVMLLITDWTAQALAVIRDTTANSKAVVKTPQKLIIPAREGR